MAFFKKLKERLFSLNIEEENNKTKKENTNNEKIKKEERKLNKKIEKEIKSRNKKEKKINKYVAGLSKTGNSFSKQLREIQSKHNKIDEEFFEEIEELLIMSDISVKLVEDILYEVKKEVKIQNIQDPKLISEIIADKIFIIYTNNSIVNTNLNIEENRLNIIMMVGVNGVGKTTTIAKIANKYVKEGKKVLIAAGDTFRAGAVDQLEVWSKKINCDIVKPIKEKVHPSSVVYDAISKAKKEKYDLLIIDTAGRLQNKVNLMNELEKINKIIQKEIENEKPHETLLVIDATTGQNGVSQAKEFQNVANVSGIVLTKMDGTSKGGIILTIKDQLKLSVKLIGLGEKIDDLQQFDLDAFIYGMMKEIIDDEKK